MQIIPVIDIRNGVAVHAIAGQRSSYRPLTSRLVTSHEPARVLEQLASAFPFRRCYVADLDAIEGRALNRCTLSEMARTGISLMVDAGAVSLAQTEELLDLGVHVVIVPTESLSCIDQAHQLLQTFQADQLCASIDLSRGQILTRDPEWLNRDPEDLAGRFKEMGFHQILTLDLAAVGTGSGIPTLALCRAIRARWPNLQLISGGGVHSSECLTDAETAGIDGLLISSALHDGRLAAELLKKFRS